MLFSYFVCLSEDVLTHFRKGSYWAKPHRRVSTLRGRARVGGCVSFGGLGEGIPSASGRRESQSVAAPRVRAALTLRFGLSISHQLACVFTRRVLLGPDVYL
jgi:hypothetical protein